MRSLISTASAAANTNSVVAGQREQEHVVLGEVRILPREQELAFGRGHACHAWSPIKMRENGPRPDVRETSADVCWTSP